MTLHHKMLPFSQISNNVLSKLKLIAADIDDTLTIQGKLTTLVIEKLIEARQSGLRIVLVTGRAAGLGQALVNYFDFIDYLIAENGLVLIDNQGGLKSIYSGEADFERVLASNGERIREEFNLLYTHESCFSLFEKTFIRPPHFSSNDLNKCNNIVDQGFEVVASSIHIHIRPNQFNKGDALLHVLRENYPEVTAENVITIGDSPSDGPLFKNFPISVGVANVAKYKDELGSSLPGYISESKEGYGFVEILDRILNC